MASATRSGLARWPDGGSGPWTRRPFTLTPSSRIGFRRSRTPPLPRKRRGVPGQDHLTDCTHGPCGHRQPLSRRDRASTPFPWLDHPPRGCRVPRPEARNRGYSYPSGGRVRALQAILRPWIPPNRPQATQNGCERGSSAGRVGMARMANTQSARGPPTGGSSSPRRSRPSYPAGPVRQGSRPAGPSAMTGQRSVAATATGLGGWSAPCPPRLRQAGIGGGQRGHSPPPASAGRRTECGPKEYAGLSPIACVKPAPAGALESARNRCRADARRRQWPLGRRPGTRLRA